MATWDEVKNLLKNDAHDAVASFARDLASPDLYEQLLAQTTLAPSPSPSLYDYQSGTWLPSADARHPRDNSQDLLPGGLLKAKNGNQLCRRALALRLLADAPANVASANRLRSQVVSLVLSGTHLDLKRRVGVRYKLIERCTVDFSPLIALPHLESLWVGCDDLDPVRATGYEALGECSQLKNLTISAFDFPGTLSPVPPPPLDLRFVASLSSLERLDVPVKCLDGVQHLRNLRQLTVRVPLYAWGLLESVERVQSLPSLRELRLAFVSEDGLASLLSLPLETLALAGEGWRLTVVRRPCAEEEHREWISQRVGVPGTAFVTIEGQHVLTNVSKDSCVTHWAARTHRVTLVEQTPRLAALVLGKLPSDLDAPA